MIHHKFLIREITRRSATSIRSTGQVLEDQGSSLDARRTGETRES